MALKRVLIVEDTNDIGRLYQETLRAAYPGVGVTFVPSAEEAILETSRYTFDLMVTDIRLPGMSGFDLIRKFRMRQQGVKIIMITGLTVDAALQKRAADVGAELLLAKPISVFEFLSAVETVTGEPPQVSIADVEATKPGRKKTGVLRRSAMNEPRTEPLLPPAKIASTPSAAVESKKPEPPSVPVIPREPAGPTLGSTLADLRGSLGALAAILLDDNGRLAAQAGDWPDPALESRLVPDVMASLSTFGKLSAHIRPGLPAAVQALRGPDFDLVLAPVGRYALLVFLRVSSAALRLALAFEQVIAVQAQLAGILEGMSLNIRPPVEAPLPTLENTQPAVVEAHAPVQAAAEPPLPEDPAALKTLEDILGKTPVKAVAQDADAFWDNLVSGDTPSAPSSGALSYDQARKLGLLPEENPS